MNALRRLIWDISSATASFHGKERLFSLLTQPRDTGENKIWRQGVRWSLRGHDLNEFFIAVRANHSPKLSQRLAKEIRENGAPVLWGIGANMGAVSLPAVEAIRRPSCDHV